MTASVTFGVARLAVTLTALVLLPPAAAAQWVQQSPTPHGLLLHDAAAPSPDAAFLASDDSEWDDPRGPLFRTTDGGASWADVPLPNQFGFYDVFFLDSQRGWAVGDINWRTTDGGLTWQQMPFLGSAYYVEFYTPTFGYTSGNFGRMVSRNGGVSWQISPGQSYAFSFRDDQTGLAASPGGIRRSTDGGQTFAVVRSGAAKDVEFLTSSVALAVAGGRLLRSADAGLTWTDEGSAQGQDFLLRVSSDVALALTLVYNPGEGRLLRTADGGQTWSDLGDVVPGGIHRIDVLDARTVVAASLEGHVWRSADAGRTWTRTLVPPPAGCDGLFGQCEWGLDFAGAHGWLVGGYGLVLESRDGGLTWRQNSNGYGDAAEDVDRFDDRRMLVASGRYALRTTDGGVTWTLVADATESDGGNYAVQTVDDQFAVLLAGTGLVSKTTDGGATWTAANPIPHPYFSASDRGDVHFRSRTDGWVVGRDLDPTPLADNDQNVWHTTDGGQTWARPNLPATDNDVFVAVDFEGQRGWIASGVLGEYKYLRTTNGGATWVYEDLPDAGPYNLADIEFFDEDTGYAVGWYGYAARSTDGGQSWTVLDIPPSGPGPGDTYTMFDLYLTSPTDVWVATTDDAVLHSDDGGKTWEELAINSRPEAFGAFVGVAATTEGSAWVAGFAGHIYALDPPAAAPVAVVAAPVNPPVVIGPDGGSFQFRVTLTNTSDQPQTFEAWTEVTGPISRSPVLGPRPITLPPNATVTRTLTQAVPGNAPAGTYTYAVNVGDFPAVLASDGFPVVKAGGALAARAASGAASAAGGWAVSGWDEAALSATAEVPAAFALSAPAPNPTGGLARLTLSLPETQVVRAEVYDALGRRVALLHEGVLAAGRHALTLDVSTLPSGVYVVRATGGEATAVRRLVVAR